MQFSEVVVRLGMVAADNSLSCRSDLNPEITGVAAIDQTRGGQLSFIEGDRFAHYLQQTQASALILPSEAALQQRALERQIAWIATPQPRLLFAQAIALFYQPWQPEPAVHPTAVIHPTARIGQGVAIGAHVVIQAGVQIGDGVCIHPQVVVYPQVTIGDRSVLHAHCVLHERTQIGADCIIHSGAVIGAEGFGFVPTATGWYKMPQSGRTILEAEVEVGCNTTIDRPAVGETRIGRGSKIDNLVQIGHGCQLGENCALAAQVGLAGGGKLGARVVLAGQVGIADHCRIGAGAIATAGAGIPGDVKAGAVVSGFPAIDNKTWLKAAALYRRLPELYQLLKQLRRQLNPNR